METNQSRFYNGPTQKNLKNSEADNQVVCSSFTTEKTLPLLGYVLVSSTTSFCQDISHNLLNLLQLDRDDVVGKSIDQLFQLDADVNGMELIKQVHAELENETTCSFSTQLNSSSGELKCLITIHDHFKESDQLLFICQAHNQNQPKVEDEETNEAVSWNVIRKSVHKLNNILTAFYCHWDLMSKKQTSDPDVRESYSEINSLMVEASQEVRNITLTANDRISKLKQNH